jgi:hypothetical protein
MPKGPFETCFTRCTACAMRPTGNDAPGARKIRVSCAQGLRRLQARGRRSIGGSARLGPVSGYREVQPVTNRSLVECIRSGRLLLQQWDRRRTRFRESSGVVDWLSSNNLPMRQHGYRLLAPALDSSMNYATASFQ